ncbi:MAG: translation elongation factor Ts [Deltaproteobacteria bacterium]|jgi:elongation factor Ts|nr:translation elongation factor Ts [Deltaproteobacteria bacterium]
MAITSQMVKILRDKTNAGMMDCKKALTECGGDIEKAVDWLRQKGLMTARKRAGRATKEGLVLGAESSDGQISALVELNSETDFVAKMDSFRELTATIATYLVENTDTPADVAGLLTRKCPRCGQIIGELISSAVGTTGENMNLRRFAVFNAPPEGGLVHTYIHMGGRLGVMVSLKAEKKGPEAVELAHNLAMQIAAANPLSIGIEHLPPEVIERERAVLTVKAEAEAKAKVEKSKGKNLDINAILPKIIEGQLKKFYSEVVLLEQPYVKEPSKNMAQVLKEAKDKVGQAEIAAFVRFQLGEELEGDAEE